MFCYRTKHQTTPIFITYHKQDDVELSVDYGDEFLNPKTLLWYTRNQRTFKSNEIKELLYSDEYDNTIHIFVKKEHFENNQVYLNESIRESLRKNKDYRKLLEDAVQTGFLKAKQYKQNKRLTLYEKYTKKDVCRLLNWDQDEKGTMFGYRTKHQTTPIFITYHKQDDVELSVDYGDEFLNPKTLLWYTRNQRTFKSNEIKELLYSDEYDNTI